MLRSAFFMRTSFVSQKKCVLLWREASKTQEEPRSALPDRPEYRPQHRRHSGCLS